MISKWTAALTALAVGLTAAAAPTQALARDYRYHGYYRHHYDRGDAAVAAGAVGLILGLAVGSALSDHGPRRAPCYDNGQYCEPPQNYGPPPSYQGDPNTPPPDYRDDGGKSSSNYAPDDRRADYERDYGTAPQQEADNASCVRPTQQWDPYAGRYVWVNLRTC